MIFERSDTELDRLSEFTPQSFLGAWPPFRGRVAPRHRAGVHGAPHRMRLGGLGQWDFMTDTAALDTGSTGTSGLDWNSLIETGAQVYTTYTQAELQRDLASVNLTRASQGLAPIPASSVAPQMNVGLAGDTQRTLLMLGLGMAVILGGAYAFGVIGKGRGKRRR